MSLSKAGSIFAYSLYVVLFTVLLPLLCLRLLWRSRRAPDYRRRILERFGFVPFAKLGNQFALRYAATDAPRIWVHAVSVGETVAIVPTIKELLVRYPDAEVLVTTTTPTGSERVAALLGDQVSHCYMPYDWPPFVFMFLRRLRPTLAIFVETELWPISIGLCKKMGVSVLVANARLSEKSARGYQKLSWLARPMLQDIAIAAQHADDAARFVRLGASSKSVQVLGSIKFDVQVSREQRVNALELKTALNATSAQTIDNGNAPLRFVWIAASTHEGEDAQILDAHQQLLERHPDALLLIVPRHPERFDQVADLVAARALRCVRRSQQGAVDSETQVYVIDTMGELGLLYGATDVAFIGGSLVPVGGHNYLEACAWGLPVLTGPHRHNFQAIADELVRVGALAVVNSPKQLAESLVELCEDPRRARDQGARGATFLQSHQGATEKLLELIEKLA